MLRNDLAACIAGASLILVGLATPSGAVPLSFAFEGFIDFRADNFPLDDSVAVGTPFVGGYTFDPAGVEDYYPDNSLVGSYSFGGSGSMWLQVADYSIETGDLGMLIWNNMGSGDLYGLVNLTPFWVAGVQWRTMSLALGNRRGTALESDAIPLTTPDLSQWPDFAGIVFNWQDHTVTMRARLTSLTPEPGSLALFAVGAAGLAVRRRRCCRTSRA